MPDAQSMPSSYENGRRTPSAERRHELQRGGRFRRSQLGVLCKRLRKDADLTQQQLADRLDVTQSAVSLAENYREGDSSTEIRLRIIQLLSGATVQGPCWIISGKGLPASELS